MNAERVIYGEAMNCSEVRAAILILGGLNLVTGTGATIFRISFLIRHNNDSASSINRYKLISATKVCKIELTLKCAFTIL